MSRRPLQRRGERVLRAIRPDRSIGHAYRRKLCALVGEMSRSYEHWICAKYRANPPRMAMDAMPASELEKLLRKMGVYWSARFEKAAPRLAEYFATSVRRRSEASLKRILRDSGISVRTFEMTPQLRDVMKAEIEQNVSLIRSIPAQYHTQVEGLVMRSVAAGRDLQTLTKELHERYGVTERRAAFIALDQNNKATAAIQRERQTAVGLTEGIWMHSHAGKEPRPTHVANDQQRFDIRTGWFDPDPQVRRRIWPGELIRCRCTWRPIVKGLS